MSFSRQINSAGSVGSGRPQYGLAGQDFYPRGTNSPRPLPAYLSAVQLLIHDGEMMILDKFGKVWVYSKVEKYWKPIPMRTVEGKNQEDVADHLMA